MLREHTNKMAKTLSGGMKRKLSLAMALVGHSRLIILDEPTSGLDVESRRQVWDLIKKIKRGRSIIMSTQHLEEADELSDRICIMSHGRLLALDTSFNIKKQFGVGYNLSIESKCDPSEFARIKATLDDAILNKSGI
jgi:ABC-type multidrug transport system ATPase subunit